MQPWRRPCRAGCAGAYLGAMRLWSLHPGHLDRQGLTACWREGLLAQAVLAGRTRGYTRHPQLDRFRELPDPLGGVGNYLWHVAQEATRRGYRFDTTRVIVRDPGASVEVTSGQVSLEWELLLAKLRVRSPEVFTAQSARTRAVHPMMREVAGPVAAWERQVAVPVADVGPTRTRR